jgi:hypothetical protein
VPRSEAAACRRHACRTAGSGTAQRAQNLAGGVRLQEMPSSSRNLHCVRWAAGVVTISQVLQRCGRCR